MRRSLRSFGKDREMKETARHERAIDECINWGTIWVMCLLIQLWALKWVLRLALCTCLSAPQLPLRFLSADVKSFICFHTATLQWAVLCWQTGLLVLSELVEAHCILKMCMCNRKWWPFLTAQCKWLDETRCIVIGRFQWLPVRTRLQLYNCSSSFLYGELLNMVTSSLILYPPKKNVVISIRCACRLLTIPASCPLFPG